MGWKDEARTRVKTKQSGGKFKLAEGENILRILPNKQGDEFPPYAEFRAHREVGPDKRMIRCGISVMGKGKCWLCNKLAEMQNSGNRAKIAAASSMSAVDQMAAQVAVLNQKTAKL